VSEVRARVGHSSVHRHVDPVWLLWGGRSRGNEVAALATALTLTVATLEVVLVGHVRLFFDLCFVVICLLSALMVRPRDFFPVGVLPPLLMFATMVLVAFNGPQVIATAHDSTVQAIITGLAHHSVALFAGYAVCLLTLLARQRLPQL
jgi:hypothetical protein